MKIPKSPPRFAELPVELTEDSTRLHQLMSLSPPALSSGNYLHWDQLVHRDPPSGFSHREWWFALKFHRHGLFKEIPFADTSDEPFKYLITDPIPERLHQIDLSAGGRIEMPSEITNPDTRDRYYVASLIEEAITSSQLEGASTTRRVAKEMIRSGRPPKDRSERMIFNNYITMKAIGRFKNEPLSKELLFRIHRSVMQKTLDDPDAAGRFRADDEEVYVSDPVDTTVLHSPPPAGGLESRMEAMCKFANGNLPNGFLHPILRSIMLHFWLAYDHPFVDGNGRTARALFYWSMLRNGYWLAEFITISHIIRKGPARYSRAFLYTETDENDLTYFILYHLDIINRSIKALQDYIKRKTTELQRLQAELRSLSIFNHRQRAILSHALRHPFHQYTIHGHQESHNVVYQTARMDLLDLSDRGILEGKKTGNRWVFTAPGNLEEELAGRTL